MNDTTLFLQYLEPKFIPSHPVSVTVFVLLNSISILVLFCLSLQVVWSGTEVELEREGICTWNLSWEKDLNKLIPTPSDPRFALHLFLGWE
jgi:hypothetical protein